MDLVGYLDVVVEFDVVVVVVVVDEDVFGGCWVVVYCGIFLLYVEVF